MKADARREFVRGHLDCCRREREDAQRALEMLDQGVMPFQSMGPEGRLRDATEELKAHNRRIIEDMDRLIPIIEQDLRSLG